MGVPEVSKDPSPTPEGVKPIAEGASRWDAATKQTRETAKWIIASLAVAAGVIFGAGPVVAKPALSWVSDRTQLIVACTLGCIGVIAIVLLIAITAQVLIPVRTTLDSVPKSLKTDLKEHASSRLPSDAHSFSEFREKLKYWTAYSAGISSSAPAAYRDPSISEASKEALREDVKTAEENRKIYEDAAAEILDQAGYMKVADLYSKNRVRTVMLAVLAAIGGIGFVLALSTRGDSTGAPSAAISSSIAYLREPSISNEAGQRLWTSLNLQACATGTSPEREVPVLKTAGKGSPEDPYLVQTISLSPSCPKLSFNTINDVIVLRVVEPESIAINYTTTAPTSPSSSGNLPTTTTAGPPR